MSNNIAITLPFGNGTVIIDETESGYDFSISDAENPEIRVKAFSIISSKQNFRGEPIYSAQLICYKDHFDQHIRTHEELIGPDNMPTVIFKDGRPFCRECHCFVPNTANTEMRKEGCFAHSHSCGIRADGEEYVVPKPLVEAFQMGEHDPKILLQAIGTVTAYDEVFAAAIKELQPLILELPGVIQTIKNGLNAETPYFVDAQFAAVVSAMQQMLWKIYDIAQPFDNIDILTRHCAKRSRDLSGLLQELERHWTIK